MSPCSKIDDLEEQVITSLGEHQFNVNINLSMYYPQHHYLFSPVGALSEKQNVPTYAIRLGRKDYNFLVNKK